MPDPSACDPPPGSEATPLYAAEELTRFVAGVLRAIGTSEPDARFMAEVIVAAEISGHECHGLRRLPEYVARWRCGAANPAATPASISTAARSFAWTANTGSGTSPCAP